MPELTTGMKHGIIMMVSFGWLLPMGILSAKFLKHRNAWYNLHLLFQILGLMIGMVGFGIAVSNFDTLTRDGPKEIGFVHACFGVMAFVLAILQPINGMLRPPTPDPSQPTAFTTLQAKITKRRRWEHWHRRSGFLALLLAFVAIMLGTKMEGPNWVAGYLLGGVGSLVMVWIFLWRDQSKFRARRKQNHNAMSIGAADTAPDTSADTEVPSMVV